MLTLALATWSVQDPSFSHATDAPVRNLLGRAGAIAADLADSAVRACLDRAGAAGRGLGLADADASPDQPQMAACSAFWLGGLVSLAAFRILPAARASAGRCRPAWAASWATPC